MTGEKKRVECPLCKGSGRCTVFTWGGVKIKSGCLTCFGLGVIFVVPTERGNDESSES